jgi:hypothetical protein
MNYAMREITDDNLHRNMANRFRTELGRKYWLASRQAFENDIKDRRDRHFFQIAEYEYRKAIQTSPLKEPDKADSQKLNLQPLVTFTAGGAIVAVVSLMIRRRRKR